MCVIQRIEKTNAVYLSKGNRYCHFVKQFFVCVVAIFFCGQTTVIAQTTPKGVEIMWDEWDVPHVFSKTQHGLYYGFGWSQMQAHSEKILQLFGQARGHGTMYWGKSNQPADELSIKIGIPELAEKWLMGQSAESKQMLQSFVSGMNDYCQQHLAQIDPNVRKVLPIRSSDPIALLLTSYHLGVVGFNLQRQADSWKNAGSNAWALSSKKLEKGPSLLVIQPHPPWTDSYQFFEAHLKTSGLNVYGIALLGLPSIAMGFNDHLGWGMTFNQADGVDMVEVEFKDKTYNLGGKWVPYSVKKSVFFNEQGKADTLFVKQTAYGPVIKEMGNKGIAIRLSGLDRIGFLDQFGKMARAKNLTEFESAMAMLQLPVQNIVYADKHGEIFYLYNAYTPVRTINKFQHWQQLQQGGDSQTLVKAYHSYKDLPKIKNPASGFLMNSNNPPWYSSFPKPLDPQHYPSYLAPDFLDFRSQRSLNMLMSKPTFSFDDIVSLQQSTYCELADKTINDIVQFYAHKEDTLVQAAIKLMKSWDRTTFRDSRGSVLFASWVFKCARIKMFNQGWSPADFLLTPSGVTKEALELFAVSVQDMMKRYGRLDISWGEVYEIKYQDMVVPSSIGLNETGSFSAGFYSRSGNKFLYQGGLSFSSVIAFGPTIQAKGILGYGNISSKLYDKSSTKKQLQLLSDGKLRDIFFYEQDIRRHIKQVITL